MPELHKDINKYEVHEDKDYVDSDYYLEPFVTPEIVAKELQAFFDKPIPECLEIYESISPQTVFFELFAFDATHYKYEHDKAIFEAGSEARKAAAKDLFDKKKKTGAIPLDRTFEWKEEFTPLAVFTDPSGQANTIWKALPIAKILAMGETSEMDNPNGLKVGDIVKLPDDWVWSAENPVYQQYINHPEKNMKGAVQVTKPPMRWIYNAFAPNGRLGSKAINLNPLNNKNLGFTYQGFVPEFKGKLNKEKLLNYVW